MNDPGCKGRRVCSALLFWLWGLHMMDDEIEFHEVDRDRRDDLEGQFNSRGRPKYCWCMVWRTIPAGASPGDRGAKKEAL